MLKLVTVTGTGTGKTLAFALPIIEQMLASNVSTEYCFYGYTVQEGARSAGIGDDTNT